jgi:hypothetical protein
VRARVVSARRPPLAALVLLSCGALLGCGSSDRAGGGRNGAARPPAYVTEPFTPEQVLVEKGARLVVADGCAACHLDPQGRRIAPSFTSLAGQRVELADGRRVVVDERFLRESMRDPQRTAMRGYDASVMVKAIAPLALGRHPRQVDELAAFIEQVGPEDP